jgi:hypothetical protein
MSIRATMLLAYVGALREPSVHSFSWEHCARVIAASLIGEGA